MTHKLTKKQKAHMDSLNESFVALNTAKYINGQKEHGTNLYEYEALWLVKEALNEMIDGFNYIKTAIDQLEDQITIDVKKGSKMDKFLREMLDIDIRGKDKNTTDKSAPK
jgi:hypothetical protein